MSLKQVLLHISLWSPLTISPMVMVETRALCRLHKCSNHLVTVLAPINIFQCPWQHIGKHLKSLEMLSLKDYKGNNSNVEQVTKTSLRSGYLDHFWNTLYIEYIKYSTNPNYMGKRHICGEHKWIACSTGGYKLIYLNAKRTLAFVSGGFLVVFELYLTQGPIYAKASCLPLKLYL